MKKGLPHGPPTGSQGQVLRGKKGDLALIKTGPRGERGDQPPGWKIYNRRNRPVEKKREEIALHAFKTVLKGGGARKPSIFASHCNVAVCHDVRKIGTSPSGRLNLKKKRATIMRETPGGGQGAHHFAKRVRTGRGGGEEKKWCGRRGNKHETIRDKPRVTKKGKKGPSAREKTLEKKPPLQPSPTSIP